MTLQSPFVGLRTFETNDAAWFFGRDRETSALAAKLRSADFTAVVGPSGSGKSSLVRAGVVPLLRRQGWKEIVAKPGSAPIDRLARALALASPEPHFAEARRFRFDTALRASAFGLVNIVENLDVDAPRLLLVIDQFEELFRYGDEASGASKAGMREESRAFVELLLTGASGSNGRLRVCVTMRSDFFGACSSYSGLAEAISVSQFLVPLPARSQLELAIRNPVKRAGAEIEEALVQRLLVDVEEEQDQLPLLQHTLRRLWEYASGDPRTMREQDYVTIGRIAGSIDRKAETIWQALGRANTADLVTLELVMKALTDLDVRGRATRRMQKRDDLLPLLNPVFADATLVPASLDRVTGSLANEENSFLQKGEGAEIDIGHEALIRSWKRLSGPRADFESGWLREERDDGARWRGYVTRAQEGTLLSLRERLNVSKWLRRRWLGKEWSQRYGNRWDIVKKFIAKSWWRGITWATAGAICVALAATGLWYQDWIKWQIHKIRDIGPFAESQIWPYVLNPADEKALQPFQAFSECAAFSMCPEMVVIPPGKFKMGSDIGPKNERPPHPVEIMKRLAVAKYEVTNDQWMTCVDHGWCDDKNGLARKGPGDHPVVSITWYQAMKYVDWLSQMTHREYRLPSEAEWEYIARAGTTTRHYWDDGKDVGAGNADCVQCNAPPIEAGHANCAECGNGDAIDDRGALPVGQFPPNQFGLCDTLGNVWEFTADMWHPNYQGAPSDGSVWWDERDPDHRVARGNSFSSNAVNVTASYRFYIKDTDWYPGMGFRVARTLDAGSADVRSTEVKPVARLGSSDRRNTCQLEQPK